MLRVCLCPSVCPPPMPRLFVCHTAASRRAARRAALEAAGASLARLQLGSVTALARLVAFRALPPPDADWLTARLVPLLGDQTTTEVCACACACTCCSTAQHSTASPCTALPFCCVLLNHSAVHLLLLLMLLSLTLLLMFAYHFVTTGCWCRACAAAAAEE